MEAEAIEPIRVDKQKQRDSLFDICKTSVFNDHQRESSVKFRDMYAYHSVDASSI